MNTTITDITIADFTYNNKLFPEEALIYLLTLWYKWYKANR